MQLLHRIATEREINKEIIKYDISFYPILSSKHALYSFLLLFGIKQENNEAPTT